MRPLTLLFLLLIVASCDNSSGVNQKVTDKYSNLDQRLLVQIKALSGIKHYDIGPYEFGDPDHPDTTHPYFYLRDSATANDLKLLTTHPNSLVRIFSFRVLAERNDSSAYRIVNSHLTDTAKVEVWDYDYGWNSTVADQMVNLCVRQLDSLQISSLRDSVLLSHNYLGCTNQILFNMQPLDQYYAITRKFAEDNFSESAYIALASYQKQADIPLIKKGFEDFNPYTGEIFKAVELFPDTAFLPILFAYFKTSVQLNANVMDDYLYYYRALAKYQRQDCLDILNEMKLRKYYNSEGYWNSNQVYIFEASYKYNCPLYYNLINELKPQIPEYVFKYLDEPYHKDRSVWWD